MRLFHYIPAYAALFLLTACSAPSDMMLLKKTTFKDLPGWQTDTLHETIPTLLQSCGRIAKKETDAPVSKIEWAGTSKSWQEACAGLSLLVLGTDEEARTYFETAFTPYVVYGDQGREGLFTGYYEPELRGSLEKKEPYIYPLYARPKNMFTADLGDFYPDLKGKKITGRVDGEKFVPFYKRAEIENGALDEEMPVIWVDNAVDAFFLHIQGSGVVKMEDGSTVHVGYAAQNGHAYTAIGKALIAQGALTKENVTMQSIRAWLEANPDKAADIMNINESYVFFKAQEGPGPMGAEGVPLTPERSMAVDRTKIPYGTPVFIDAEHPADDTRLQRVMIAQDTGGAIKGAVRGDYFWGAGAEAAENAGKMKSKGYAYLLLPRTLEIPAEKKWHWWRMHASTQKAEYNE